MTSAFQTKVSDIAEALGGWHVEPGYSEPSYLLSVPAGWQDTDVIYSDNLKLEIRDGNSWFSTTGRIIIAGMFPCSYDAINATFDNEKNEITVAADKDPAKIAQDIKRCYANTQHSSETGSNIWLSLQPLPHLVTRR